MVRGTELLLSRSENVKEQIQRTLMNSRNLSDRASFNSLDQIDYGVIINQISDFVNRKMNKFSVSRFAVFGDLIRLTRLFYTKNVCL